MGVKEEEDFCSTYNYHILQLMERQRAQTENDERESEDKSRRVRALTEEYGTSEEICREAEENLHHPMFNGFL